MQPTQSMKKWILEMLQIVLSREISYFSNKETAFIQTEKQK